MEGHIPNDVIERVRSATDIVELVSESVSLKRSGANYLGLCPFHNEKSPSFTVSPSKQIFHCFGCGAGGDSIGFLIRKDNYSYPEAVRKLADRAGIIIPEVQRDPKLKSDFDDVLKANAEAEKFFEAVLLLPEGSKAREYLDKRGMAVDLREKFHIGWSLNSWDALLHHLGSHGVSADKAERAGLAIKRASGQGMYDRFRERVIFPIRDVRGRVIGFGGRAMGDEMPKYLNSPETSAFKKGETLYAIDIAADEIRKKGYSVIVEGYMDAIACHGAGADNAVATMGTALTPSHLRLLRRYSKNVLLVFDSDAAGQKAAERSLDVFLAAGTDMTAKVAILPEGDDPDSLVKREGPEGLRKWLGQSEKLVEFVIKRLAKNAVSIEDKVTASGLIIAHLARIENSVERSHYIRFAANQLAVEESALREELAKKTGRRDVYEGPRKPSAPQAGLSRIEEGLLHIMLHHPDVAGEVIGTLSPEDFPGPEARSLAVLIYRMHGETGAVGVPELLDRLDDEKLKGLVLKLVLRGDIGDDVKGYAEGAVKSLREAQRQKGRLDIQRRIREAEESGDFAKVAELSRSLMGMKAAPTGGYDGGS